MTAISKAWVTIADGAVDPDSPVDTALMTALRDNQIHLREWLGSNYTAGAVQDHNHDGQNSALVEIGPNSIRNGSFESGLTGWTTTAYSGGTIAVGTTNNMDGANALAITSTSTVNGGGAVVSGEFVNCSGGVTYGFGVMVRGSVANISSRARVIWYDSAKSQISTSDIYTNTNTPTAVTSVRTDLTAPSSARFYKIELTGGVPASGSATGTIYFDGFFAIGVRDTDVYAVGGYVLGRPGNGTTYSVGDTVAGSALYSTQAGGAYVVGEGWSGGSGQSLVGVGSWRCVSSAVGGSTARVGLWVRYA
ncbi:hypothetical protein P3G55_23185 [Leptospira sp. 96542]|nr:hypothetical protein [Leptospira sp. 96542]